MAERDLGRLGTSSEKVRLGVQSLDDEQVPIWVVEDPPPESTAETLSSQDLPSEEMSVLRESVVDLRADHAEPLNRSTADAGDALPLKDGKLEVVMPLRHTGGCCSRHALLPWLESPLLASLCTTTAPFIMGKQAAKSTKTLGARR